MSQPGRRVYWNIFQNILKTFKIRKVYARGNYVGCDQYGNKFYENPAEDGMRSKLPRRSFEPAEEMKFDVDNMSAEWDSWLRHKRHDPPTIEELKYNMHIAEQKKENAGKAESSKDERHASIPKATFPEIKGYERKPGIGLTKHDPKKM